MEYRRIDKIDDKARAWIVRRGPDGRLHDELDLNFFAKLHPAQSAQEITDALATLAGEMEIASTRLW